MNALSELESDHQGLVILGVDRLYDQYTKKLILEALESYEIDQTWSIDIQEHVLLSRFINYSCRNICIIDDNVGVLQQVIVFFTTSCYSIITNHTIDIIQYDQLLLSFSNLFLVLIKYIIKEQAHSISDDVSNNLDINTTTTTTIITNNTTVSYKLLVNNLSNILNSFVFSSLWNRNIFLQEQKLKFIAVLTNLSLGTYYIIFSYIICI